MSFLQSSQELQTLSEYRESSFHENIDHFIDENPHPFLLIEFGGIPLDDTGGFQTNKLSAALARRMSFNQKKQTQFVAPVKKNAMGTNDPSDSALSIITLGRKGGNDIVIRELNISKVHCFFKETPEGHFYLKDSNSTNGTWVSGQRLPAMEPWKMMDLDEILIGNYVLAQFFMPETFFRVVWPD